jgi:hypothetical protein
MQCLKLLILALVQKWTPLQIPKWLLLLSLYEASRQGGGGGGAAKAAPGGPLIPSTYWGGLRGRARETLWPPPTVDSLLTQSSSL